MDQTHALEVNPYASDTLPPAPTLRAEHRESLTTRMLEHQVAKLPSDAFLAAEMTGRPRLSRFVGMWVGPLLTMGVYNKIVKTLGVR
jgi:hypothetical protein